LASKTPIKQR